MYIDPNTGGVLFQALAFLLVCSPFLAIVVVGGVVVYFVKKGKNNSNKNSTKDSSNL